MKHTHKSIALVLLVIVLLAPLTAKADGMKSLWNQVTEARRKDLPQTEMKVLGQIIARATKAHDYGNLLAAELMYGQAQVNVSADSLQPAVARLERLESHASDVVLDAVYASVLGRIYADAASIDGHEEKSRQYYAKSMLHPDKLIECHTSQYKPLFEEGADSRIFKDDLLHVIGMASGDYKTLHDVYTANGNRPAACISALYMLRDDGERDFRKSHYRAQLDSLLQVYGDLTEAGEVAIARYEYMERATGIDDKDRYEYLNYAISKWGAWTRMENLRQCLKQLTRPTFCGACERVALPGHDIKLMLNNVRNVGQVDVTLHRLDIDGSTVLPSTLSDLCKNITTKDIWHTSLRFVGNAPYAFASDSTVIPGQKAGVYLLEMRTDNSQMKTDYQVVYVSNVALMSLGMPSGDKRFVVVDATTGRPLSKASIRFRTYQTSGDRASAITRECDANGELSINTERKYVYLQPCTSADPYCPETSVEGAYSFYEPTGNYKCHRIFTDREIYRPGQTVHAAVICYRNERSHNFAAVAKETFSVALRDANYKVVATKEVTTDEYGKAAADFQLPASGLTGRFTLRAGNSSTTIRVEEYKRPTFDVTFPKVNQRYQIGDTIEVTASAKTYAGVAVQGAKVKCRVVRRPVFFWWGGDDDDATVSQTETVTDADGCFKVAVPLLVEKGDGARFYNFVVTADVTDISGESHTASFSLPVGTKAAAFNISLPDMTLSDSLRTIKFDYKNVLGEDIPATVNYRFDNQPMQQVAAGKDVALKQLLASGRHRLFAVCGTDTLQRDIVIFSLKDRKPAVETDDWFYCSDGVFPADGRPVYIQVGASTNDQYIYYSVFAKKQLLEKGVIKQSDAVTLQKYCYKDEYADGICLAYAWVKDGKFYQHFVRLQKPMENKELGIKWTTFRNRLSPGQKEKWQLHVTMSDGRPADAQLMATLYDKSLDQIAHHQWSLPINIARNMPMAAWNSDIDDFGSISSYNALGLKYKQTKTLSFSHFDDIYFDAWHFAVAYDGFNGMLMSAAPRRVMMNAKMNTRITGMGMEEKTMALASVADNDEGSSSDNDADDEADEADNGNDSVASMRENLNETAFFFPALTTDNKGNIGLEFTLPESVTTWRFMALAHDRSMNNAVFSDEVVAQREIMIQPNMPRFLREGDRAVLSAKISNTTSRQLSGKAQLEILDAQTENVVAICESVFQIDGGKSAAVTFQLPELPANVYICRVSARTSSFSDGEQHYLAVLSDKQLVTRSLPFAQNGAGTMSIDLSQVMQAEKVEKATYTIEYTNNPSWLMIQTLPSMAVTSDKNAVSQAMGVYSNVLARHLLSQIPRIKDVVALWKEGADSSALVSALRDNEELRQMVLNDTPWVMDADREEQQRIQLADYLDSAKIEARLQSQLQQLVILQNTDGSFSWCPGMKGSVYITSAVVQMLVRLNAMVGRQQQTEGLLTRAMAYIQQHVHEETTEMHRVEKKGGKVCPSETAVEWLYALSLDGRKLDVNGEADRAYLVKLLSQKTTQLTIYGKAVAAIILGRNGYKQKANEYLQSIREYTVYREYDGRYFDSWKAAYTWCSYRIPSQVAAIEALSLLQPSDSVTIQQMQRWLLTSKRTQMWDSPINTVNAVWAFMGSGARMATLLADKPMPEISVDGKTVALPQSVAGTGYVKTSLPAEAKHLEVVKTSHGTSWGAVYAQAVVKSADVKASASGIKVVREVIDGNSLKLGDKVKVRITLVADRDYDFVEVVDRRAACLEPVSQLSAYGYGYYYAPQDQRTCYFFDCLPKGTTRIETEYFIDREGNYLSGSCSAECAYAPEYRGCSDALQWSIKDKQ